MAFDLTGDFCMGAHNHVSGTGNLDLKLSFTNPLTSNLNIYMIATFENLVKVNGEIVDIDFSI